MTKPEGMERMLHNLPHPGTCPADWSSRAGHSDRLTSFASGFDPVARHLVSDLCGGRQHLVPHVAPIGTDVADVGLDLAHQGVAIAKRKQG